MPLILSAQGSAWASGHRPVGPGEGGLARNAALDLWDPPVWLTITYVATLMATATLLGLCLVAGSSGRRRLGALGGVGIFCHTLIVFAIYHQEVARLGDNGYQDTALGGGFLLAVLAIIALTSALAFAMWPAGQRGATDGPWSRPSWNT